ncbi:MAG: immunoglobulin domain-containing protein [Verrucomicrobiota bacterium]|jgi:hypothetical protein
MKKHILPAMALLASLLTAQAQVFTNTNLVVLRISGNVGTSGSGAAIYIDEFQTNGIGTNGAGSTVNSFAVPTTSGNNPVINVGLSYAGLMTMTPAATNVVFAGYNVALGGSFTGSSAGVLVDSYSSSVPRAIASVDAYGNYSMPIANPTNFSTFTIIGAASDGTNYWMSGNGPASEFITGSYPEVVYVGTGGTQTQVEVATNTFSSTIRAVNVFYNTTAGAYNLFVSGTSTNTPTTTIYHGGTFVLSNISGSLPTTQIGASNYFPDASGSGSGNTAAYDIAINPAGTIAYMADNDLGIVKYTFNGTLWVSNYNVFLTNSIDTITGSPQFSGTATSVTADWSQNPPVVYATSGETLTNRLVKFSDTNANGQDTVINLAQGNVVSGPGGITNTFRGVRLGLQQYGYISVPPVAFVGNPGDTATFSATVLGSPAPSLQWYSNSVANPTWVQIPGATTATLTLHSISQAQSGSLFYLKASNIYGSSTNTPVSLTVANPAISTEPVGATNLLGGPGVNLSVTAVGTGTLTYQWFANGVLIAGATGSTYPVPSSVSASAVTYTVVVTNTVGATHTTATSTGAIVSYTPYLLYDTFQYANGNLFTDAGSPWTDINGTNPELVINDSVQVSQTNATTDAQSLFIQDLPAGADPVVYASFLINMTTNLPTNGGVYFANLEGTNDFQFIGCVYALTSNAYPGTYRLGIACTNLDYNSTTGKGGPSAIIPVDLAPGINYQVVFSYDGTEDLAYLAINPSVTLDTSTTAFEYNDPAVVFSSDSQAFTNDIGAFGFRQRAGTGTMQISDLEVSLDTAYTNGIQAVTAGITPQAPTIGFQPIGFTNYTGASNTMEIAASAIGSGINLNYAWYKNTIASPGTYTQVHDGGDVTGSSTAAITFSDLAASDAGTYYAIASDSTGNSPQSASAVVDVITTPTAPFFVAPTPTSTTNIGATIYGSVTLTALAEGSGPISYQWNFYNGTNTTSVGTGPSLTLSSLAINQSGSYTVVATGTQSPAATSPDYVLTVSPPEPVTIAYLRSLLVTTAAPTITLPSTSAATAEYSVTGVITVATNVTTSSYASYYVQDSTGGIDFFVEDSTFRPVMGDIVTVIGTLSLFDDNLELDTTVGNPSETYSVVGGSLTPSGSLPVATVTLPVGYPQASTADAAATSQFYEGEMITLTNVYFTSYPGTFASETDYTLTNQAGISVGIEIYTDEGTGTPDTTIIGQTIPRFAYTVTGVLDQYQTGTFELNVTRYSDIVTTPPPVPGNFTAVLSGPSNNHVTLTWTASPKYAYSVLSASVVTGPYTTLSSGMTFTTSTGTYTDTNPGAGPKYYEIVSP